MPHYTSAALGNWELVCKDADISFIDPRNSVEDVIAKLNSCSLLLTEAMHGAIVADALRVPWIPLRPHSITHQMKWSDWADSVGVELSWSSFDYSTLPEAVSLLTQRRFSPRNSIRMNRIGDITGFNSLAKRRAIRSLREVALGRPLLSKDHILMKRFEEARGRLYRFVDTAHL